jgi:hypothetical protein
MVSNVFAIAPIFNDIPDLKFFVSQGLSSAFDLAQYNTGDPVTLGYTIEANGLNLTTLTGSVVGQDPYGSVTVTQNSYSGSNAGGSTSVANKVKYATYKIQKLAKVGLNVGSSYTVSVGGITLPSIPPSFGNQDALVVSDVSKVTAYWSGNDVVVTSLAAASGPVYVDVIASVDSVAPFGIDQDKERIEVNSNLVTGIDFSAAADTANFGFEIGGAVSSLATLGYTAGAVNVNGSAGNGVMTLTAAAAGAGAKVTLVPSKYISILSGTWYTVRARIAAASTAASEQFILFAYNGTPGANTHTDVSGNAVFGIPSTFTWIETPIYATGASASGYAQFQFKANGAQTLNVDEIQIVKAAPTLADASRLATRSFYSYGDFDVLADTTGWGQEVYSAGSQFAGITQSNGQLVVDFAGAGAGTAQRGIKWTATNNAPGVYTPAATVGREVGIRASVGNITGSNNSLGLVLVAGYGVASNGSLTIAGIGSNLVAAAQIGIVNAGAVRTVGKASSPFYQLQFGARSDIAGSISIDNADFDSDNDDPNYGDGSLYPL